MDEYRSGENSHYGDLVRTNLNEGQRPLVGQVINGWGGFVAIAYIVAADMTGEQALSDGSLLALSDGDITLVRFTLETTRRRTDQCELIARAAFAVSKTTVED